MKEYEVTFFTSLPNDIKMEGGFNEMDLGAILELLESGEWVELTDEEKGDGYRIRTKEIRCITWRHKK